MGAINAKENFVKSVPPFYNVRKGAIQRNIKKKHLYLNSVNMFHARDGY